MVRSTPRPRRQLPLGAEQFGRAFGWRYSIERGAWVHRFLGGRYGPVLVFGHDHDVPDLAEPGAAFPVMLPHEFSEPLLFVASSAPAPSAIASIYPEDPWAGVRVDGTPPAVADILASRFGTGANRPHLAAWDDVHHAGAPRRAHEA